MRALRTIAAVLACAVILPSLAYAQASIAGVVKDTSGGVIPGVTVEAASPALIEKVRTAVTDSNGQYRIVDLRPGTYTVTFTLQSFSTVQRAGVELTGSFTASIDVAMRIGSVEETVTVSGETPLVDVSSATVQRVVNKQVVDALPTGRTEYNLAVLVPGISLAGANRDVGGIQGHETFQLTVHGSKGDSQRITSNGISIGSVVQGGTRAGAVPNAQAFQEVTIDTGANSAELPTGGVRINFIPREGGNQFRGSMFGSFANDMMQGSNFTQRLQDRGLASVGAMRRVWDFNPGVGGPLRRDRLWFFASGRHTGTSSFVDGMFVNRNANNPSAWTFDPDPSQPAANETVWKDVQGRLTWQINPTNKFAYSHDEQQRCSCPDAISATRAYEASQDRRFPLNRAVTLEWTSPATRRVLLEAVSIYRIEDWGNEHPQTNFTLDPRMISVTEQSTGLVYRANPTYTTSRVPQFFYRAAMSYITGAHALKVGFNDGNGENYQETYHNQPISYRFNNGIPNRVTLQATPRATNERMDHDLGIYAQDRWTMDRLTVNLGVRFDYFASSFPEQTLGPGPFVPNRNLTFAAQDNLNYKDITPKLSMAWDLFGDGRTAVKASANKYLEGLATGALAATPNPSRTLVNTVNRTWTDSNGNFVPDCDLVNPAVNGECGVFDNLAFGSSVANTTFDPELLNGWNTRGYNWEFSASIQREFLPRVSAEFGYFRRIYGNFNTTDNLLVAPADFTSFSIVAPSHADLQSGGGYTVGDLYNVNPAQFGLTQNYVTHSSNYGKEIEHWNGFDATLNARFDSAFFQGGMSTGRTTTDNCAVRALLPEIAPVNPYCHVTTKFLTEYKFMGSYTIPRVDVQASATFQSIPGPQVLANYVVNNAIASPTLGRNLSGGNNQTVTVNLVEPGTMYGERHNQIDFRVAKIVRVGRTRAAVNLDLYNALNTDAILTQSNEFASWQRPTLVLPARFFKVSAQFDF